MAAEQPDAGQSAPPPPERPVDDLILYTQKHNHIEVLPSGPYDGNIARLTTGVLSRTHYSRQQFNREISDRFLRRYFELLDPQHFHFLESDLKEFDKYREELDELTGRQGDTSPANIIFARYLERVRQRVEFCAELLKNEQFDFKGTDTHTANRRHSDNPKDLTEAKQLWRQHLRSEYLQEKLNGHKPEETVKTLSNRYKQILRSLVELDSDEVLQLYLTALAQSYDPHSDYMGKAQLDNFAISMKLSLFGIGALLRSEDGYCKIQELMAGGPAIKSEKLKPNDRIIAVKQAGQEPVDVVGWKLTKVVELIRGPKGTEVTLTIIPADAADPSVRKTVTLIRDEVKLEDQEAKARIIDQPGPDGKTIRLGVIDLPSFYASFDIGDTKAKSEPKSTTVDVTRLIQKLEREKVAGLVLDLRRNGGGSLEEAVKLTGIFIKDGPVVQVRGANDDVSVDADTDPSVAYNGPLVVLVSRLSASASEILAAALQDYGRAVIVGESSTHGKGTVQTIYELNRFLRQRFPTNFNPGALKVTIRKFYRATGLSTQLKGMTPDIILPSIHDYMEIGEGAQDYALGWDTIPGAKFERVDMVKPYVDELRKRCLARQNSDPDFVCLREDIERLRKVREQNRISLNEEQRLREKAENEAREKTRNQERLARGEPKTVTYEITLKQADQPGLPAPLAKTKEPLATKVVTKITGGTNIVFSGAMTAKTNEPPPATQGVALAGSGDADGEEAEDKPPAVDVQLDEAKRVLMDLISLKPAGSASSLSAAK